MNSAANKDVVRSYAKMWNEHDSSLAKKILAENYVDHAHPELVGPQAIAQTVDKTIQAMPDFRVEMKSIVAEGDLVAFRETITMTRQGEKQRLEGMSFVRLLNGKMVERWTCYDRSS